MLARDVSPPALSFGEALYGALVFNGKPAVENGRDYQQVTFPTGELAATDVSTTGDRIRDAAPTIVVFMGGDEPGLAAIVERVESGWRSGPRPIYLLGNAPLTPFTRWLGASADRRRRLFAINPLSPPTPGARFVLRYNDVHAEKVVATRNPSASYDAFYLLAYGAYAMQDAPISGVGLARAFARLVPPGPEVEVGAAHVLEGLKRLREGSSIDVRGAGGGLDFDLTRGEAPAELALICAATRGPLRAPRP
jgi:hypothetical protein